MDGHGLSAPLGKAAQMPKSSHRGAWPGSGRSIRESVREKAPLEKAAQLAKSRHRGDRPEMADL